MSIVFVDHVCRVEYALRPRGRESGREDGGFAGHLHAYAVSLEPDGFKPCSGVRLIRVADAEWANVRPCFGGLLVCLAIDPGFEPRVSCGFSDDLGSSHKDPAADVDGDGGGILFADVRQLLVDGWAEAVDHRGTEADGRDLVIDQLGDDEGPREAVTKEGRRFE